MSDKTKIEWTDATWNPVTGCDKVSPGCDHCYAETIARRFDGTPAYPNGFKVTLRPERLDQPLRWSRPRRVFVNSMSDLLHADVPDGYIARVWAVMALAPQHTFQVLTKRPGRLRSLLSSPAFWHQVSEQGRAHHIGDAHGWLAVGAMLSGQPLPNVWLGVSAEDQRWADIRIPLLLDTPAAVRFVSAEPLLGPIDFTRHTIIKPKPPYGPGVWLDSLRGHTVGPDEMGAQLDWVICGGESGRGARPMHPDWIRSIRDQCAAAGVAFHFKQWGEWRWVQEACDRAYEAKHGSDVHPGRPWQSVTIAGDIRSNNLLPADNDTVMQRIGKKAAGRELDGRTWDEFPKAVS
ncbi:phage Gp37/Gp68 family protein [Microlunatus lacustris]